MLDRIGFIKRLFVVLVIHIWATCFSAFASESIHYTVVDKGSRATLSSDLQDWVYEMCAEYGIAGHEKLIIAQLYCESSYRADAISKTNDYGIAQINHCNHKRLSEKLGITDFLDARQSIRCGVYMMADGLKTNSGEEEKALVAYNMGQSKVNKGVVSSKYSRRVIKIKNNMEVIR